MSAALHIGIYHRDSHVALLAALWWFRIAICAPHADCFLPDPLVSYSTKPLNQMLERMNVASATMILDHSCSTRRPKLPKYYISEREPKKRREQLVRKPNIRNNKTTSDFRRVDAPHDHCAVGFIKETVGAARGVNTMWAEIVGFATARGPRRVCSIPR